MEGESPLLKDGALSLQTSLTHRELPPYPRHLRSDHLFRFLSVAGIWGKFLGLDGRCFFQSAAIAPDWWGVSGARERYAGYCLKMRCCRDRPMCRSVPGECYLLTTYNAIRKCRDSACQASAKPHPVKNLYLPERQKLPPRAPAPNRAKQIFTMPRRVLLGEVRGR